MFLATLLIATVLSWTHVYEDGSVAVRPHGPQSMEHQVSWCLPNRLCQED